MQWQPPFTSRLSLPPPFLGFRPKFSPPPPPSISSPNPRISCASAGDKGSRPQAKKKDNVWSIDNELAARELASEKKKESSTRRRRNGGGRVKVSGKKGRNGLVLVSAAMLLEIETVLQTQEPAVKPAWSTFASSVSGIWKGVGAVYLLFTAEIEPIGIGNQNENLYDCFILSCIERSSPDGLCSQVRRKTNWVALNPFGEKRQHVHGSCKTHDRDSSEKRTSEVVNPELILSSHESFDFGKSEVLEEDLMSMEPASQVFFSLRMDHTLEVQLRYQLESMMSLSTFFPQLLSLNSV